jgi:thymidylate synthase (FAD)
MNRQPLPLGDVQEDVCRAFRAGDCIKYISHMGSDARVVNAARVSLDRWVDESAELSAGDKRLIKYLADHKHVSPFFHPQVTLYLKMPIFVAREWFRHVVGISRNEVSRRYHDGPVECFLPEMVRERHPEKKQGSRDAPIAANEECLDLMKQSMDSSIRTYRALLQKGAAPEIARMVLPQSMMTQFIETASLAAYARICDLRDSPDAQIEIRTYALELDKILSDKYPYAWAAMRSDSSFSSSSGNEPSARREEEKRSSTANNIGSRGQEA